MHIHRVTLKLYVPLKLKATYFYTRICNEKRFQWRNECHSRNKTIFGESK
jgi:hypothetical protein